MKTVLASSLPLLLVPTLASAQGVPPGLSSPFAASATLDVTLPPFAGCGNNIQQVAFQQLPCNPLGQLTITMSVGNLCATYGGNGTTIGLVEGTYNVATGAVTLNTNANAIQTVGNQHFQLSLEPIQGRYCVFDSFNSGFTFLGVRFASRPACGMPFGASVPVSGIQGLTLGYSDASLGYVAGTLKLFYAGNVGGTIGIYMDTLNVSNPSAPTAAGSPVLVRGATRTGGIPNSPTPITGPDGDVEGLWHAELVSTAGPNDVLFAPTLDPTRRSEFSYVNSAWKNNGGIAGGRFMIGDGTINWVQVGEAHGSWLLGDVEAPGGSADISGGAFGTNAVTVVFLSGGVGTAITVPGFYGQFTLSFSPLIILGTMTHNVAQMGSMSTPIPNDPSLRGARIPIQGLSIDFVSNTNGFSNNAWIDVR